MSKPWNAGLDHGFSSFDINQPGPLGMAISIPLLLFGLEALYNYLGWWKGEKTKKGTPVSRVVAMEFAFGIPCCWFTYHGLALYFAWNGVDELYKAPLIDDPYYGQSDYVVNNLLWPMFFYQGWNVITALFLIPDVRSADNVFHHILTCSVQYFGFPGFMHYHSFFFIGLVEASSIPLTFVDMSRYIPTFPQDYPILYKSSQVTFALSFVILRLVLWPFVAYRVCTDLARMIINSQVHSNFVVGTFVIATILLSILQWHWGIKIINNTIATLKGEGRGSRSSRNIKEIETTVIASAEEKALGVTDTNKVN